MNRAKRLALTLVMGWAAAFAVAAPGIEPLAAAALLSPRTSDAGGVRVVVTPRVAEPGATVWEFEVVIDTHIKPLNEDLAGTAVLVDDSGRQLASLAWQGDPPGGHHRKGILRFPPPEGRLKAIEVHISGVGGPERRVFRWELN